MKVEKIIKTGSEFYTSDLNLIELNKLCEIEEVKKESVNKYRVVYYRRVYTCGCCGNEKSFENRCGTCGARRIDGVWKKICSRCGKETDKLYDLFVPHHCKGCSIICHEEARKR